MSRTPMFQRLLRLIRLAEHCERAGQSAAEAVDRWRAQQEVYHKRRELIRALGAAATTAAVGAFVPRSARAAPGTSGDIAVVGAGLAGLLCAYTLAGKGVRATAYEASERAGGRCFSLYDFFPGQVAERGGEFIDTGHTTMRGLAKTFALRSENVEKLPGEVFYFFNGQHYSEAQVVEEFRAFVPRMREDLTRLSNSPTADAFTDHDRALDFTTLEYYLESRGAGALIREVLQVAYTIEYGREIDRQSALAFLFFIHADRRAKFAPFGVFSDERFHVVEGNERIASGLINSLPGQIEYGHRLIRARKLSDGRIELAFSAGGGTVERAHSAVVLAIPFSVLREVELDPTLGLSAEKRFAIDNFDYGTNSKMMIGFDGRPWYTLFNSNGTSYSDLPNHQSTWETNPINAQHSVRGILTDYSGGDRGERLNPSQLQTEAGAFLGDLDKVYPGISGLASLDEKGNYRAFLENWSLNPLYRGSYTNNAPGYFTTIEGNAAKPVDNLFFAGEHTDSFYEWQGFMEGACLSGVRAATEAFNYVKGR